jgi:lysophospholipase L1-like esterase
MTDAETRPSAHQVVPESPEPPPEPRRVRWTYALGVCVLAFLLWLLVDAPTLQHNAQVSPVGTRRTVSLDILGPIATVSRWSQLSHVVSVSDGLLGRHGNVPGNGSSVVSLGPTGRAHHPPPAHPTAAPTGTTPPGAPVTTTTPPPSAAAPLRTLVIGDSLGIDLGDALVDDLANTGVVSATLDGEVGTGLTRPDYYNWPAELQTDLPKYKPQVVVIMIGANDGQDLPGPPDVPFNSASWLATYTQRVQSFMQEAASGGAKVVWVGMPPMENPGLSSNIGVLDGIYQTEAAQLGVTYVSSAAVIGTSSGGYTAYLQSGGQEVNVREPDGIHIAPGGAELLSQAVITAMRQQLHLQLP